MSVGSNFRELMFANARAGVFVHERDRCNKTTDADVRVQDKSNTKTGLQLPTAMRTPTWPCGIVADN